MPLDLALKILSDDANGMRIGGYAIAFGGQDLVGDRFTPQTRLSLTGTLGPIPILWGHGQDETMKTTLLGHTVSAKADDLGLWVEGVITAGKEYAEALRKILGRSKLGFSSGSVPHLVRRKSAPGGVKEITEWPIVELSCVPNPCEPRLLNVQELKSMAADEPSLLVYALEVEIAELKAELTTDARNNLSSGQFAYTDSDGTGHLPANDAGHVRAALSRFNQTHFESPAKRKAAAGKILARARAFGIDVSSDSAVAMAAKDGGKSLELDDSAYAFVEDGGTISEAKTYPLEKRHYPHHDDSGAVDADALTLALGDASKAVDPRGYAHLLRHKRAIDTGLPDDAHEAKWARGATATLLVAHTKGLALVEEVAADLDSMKRSGLDTHDDQRLYAHRAAELKTNHSSIGQPLEWAENIDRGDDGKARVDMFRHRLALLELEEVH